MSTKYFALLTQLGADKLANAAALGTKIEITHMAVGDGGGSLPVPDTKQTKLINEKRRAAINTLSIDPKNTNQIIAEQVIPEAEGGWWIREIGLYDKDGVLVAVGNCAETYKPQLQEGSGRTQTIRMILIVSSANAVTLKVDPSIVLATREYVDNSITKHANSRNHPDATLKEKGFVILSSAVDSNSETHAATPKAVKAAYDLANAANNNANTRLEKNKNGADVADKDAFNRNIGSARAFTGATHIGGGGVWTTAEFVEWLKSKGAFNHPYWMCKGSWAYSSNRIIHDTGCGSIHLAGAVVEVMGVADVMTIRVTTAPDAPASISSCVPNAQFTYGNHGSDYKPSWRRDYNTANKPTSSEVGAYSKQEADARVNAANENANSRLEKNKNGADIPNKDEFVKNLGLTETKELAKNAVPNSRRVNGKSLAGDITLNAGDVGAFSKTNHMDKIPGQSYIGAFSCGHEGEWVKGISVGTGGDVGQIWIDSSAMLHTRFLNTNGNHKQQSYTARGECYTKSESDNRFVLLNKGTITSGYLLSKTANYLDDPSSRNLGRSGFLRTNNIDGLGDFSIHIAHPNAEGPQHARGISLNYGGASDKFGLSTYAFDENGKIQGQKKILTEDNMADMLYPVGIVLWFAQNKNPNTLFPKTQWKYIGENKTIRLANQNGSNVLSAGGSDSITLTGTQIPPHNHSFSATTSNFDYGTKTTNSNGNHFHDSGWGEAYTEDARYGIYDNSRGNAGSAKTDNDNYKYKTSTEGAHIHTVHIGAHTHTVSGTTGNTGSSSAVNITNSYIMLMGWYRIS